MLTVTTDIEISMSRWLYESANPKLTLDPKGVRDMGNFSSILGNGLRRGFEGMVLKLPKGWIRAQWLQKLH